MDIKEIKDWKELFDVAFDEVLEIMSIVLEKEKGFFDQITIADGLKILEIIINQNFSENTKKNLEKLIGRVNSLFLTQSSSS